MNPGTRRLRWWKEVLAVVAFDAVYEWTSSKAAGAHAVASSHAQQVVGLERSLGMFHEHAIQRWLLPHRVLIEMSDLFYSTVHFLLPVVALVWLFRRFPERYLRWRNALAWMTGLGLIGFITYPLLPPRFLPGSYGFVDTLNAVGGIGSFDSALMKDAGNLYAAMPSLHVAWALWCAFALVPIVRRRWIKALLVLHPFVTLFTIVVTANHYFLDAVAGVLVFVAGVAIARLPRPQFTIAPLAFLYARVPVARSIQMRTVARLQTLRARVVSIRPARRPAPRRTAAPVEAAAPAAVSPNGDGATAEAKVGA